MFTLHRDKVSQGEQCDVAVKREDITVDDFYKMYPCPEMATESSAASSTRSEMTLVKTEECVVDNFVCVKVEPSDSDGECASDVGRLAGELKVKTEAIDLGCDFDEHTPDVRSHTEDKKCPINEKNVEGPRKCTPDEHACRTARIYNGETVKALSSGHTRTVKVKAEECITDNSVGANADVSVCAEEFKLKSEEIDLGCDTELSLGRNEHDEYKLTEEKLLKKHKHNADCKSDNCVKELLQRLYKDVKPYQCKICEKKFSEKGSLKKHMFTHTGEKPHSCEVCGKKFSMRCHLNKHMFTHTGERPHLCTICNLGFTQSNNLKRHMLTHTGVKPHACQVCDKKFYQTSHLSQHMLTHSGVKPYKCDICGKQYLQKTVLNQHILKHTEKKSHICTVCGKYFSDQSNLKRHLLMHSGDAMHVCNLCGKVCNYKWNLNTHMLVHSDKKKS